MTVWDEPPFVPKRGHRSSPHIVEPPRAAQIHAFPPGAALGPAAARRRSALAAGGGRNAFLCGFTCSPPFGSGWFAPTPPPGAASGDSVAPLPGLVLLASP